MVLMPCSQFQRRAWGSTAEHILLTAAVKKLLKRLLSSSSTVLQGGEVPYQRSSMGYSMDESDKDVLRFLREFHRHRRAPTAVAGDKYLVHIAKMRPDSFVDLICQACSSQWSLIKRHYHRP